MRFYLEQLGLEIRTDQSFAPGLRLVTVAPPGQSRPEIALGCSDQTFYPVEHKSKVQEQHAQMLSSIFITTHCWQDYKQLLERGITFLQSPRQQRYGVEAIFCDPDGNTFTLLEVAPGVQFAPLYFGSAA
ncbi:hypothetical protein KTT_15540 [Tengunoibacter tsumagoiensis]|uniref:VOC domain-containing protein n=1 Tax=Tengunoibacter tsumagoiensis TaxID=2014871 RepID=A0A401ZXY5_9CHLR|nr:hypothetical protein KTT_15540 [Tengunoibacter tsumagoiensis]